MKNDQIWFPRKTTTNTYLNVSLAVINHKAHYLVLSILILKLTNLFLLWPLFGNRKNTARLQIYSCLRVDQFYCSYLPISAESDRLRIMAKLYGEAIFMCYIMRHLHSINVWWVFPLAKSQKFRLCKSFSVWQVPTQVC